MITHMYNHASPLISHGLATKMVMTISVAKSVVILNFGGHFEFR